MKKYASHIILDVLSMWTLIIVSLYVAVKWDVYMIFVYLPILTVWFAYRTFKWALLLYDFIFSKPKTFITKGYRYAVRDRIYVLDLSKKIHYSKVYFDDQKIKCLLFFSSDVFQHGEALKVTYYPKSKLAIKIERL